jgi:hypothetical protein
VVNQDLPPAAREGTATAIVAGSLDVEPIRDSRLLTLKVEHTSPELAARIANSYTENFIRSSLERKFEANSYARNFLEERLAQTRQRLEDSERQLVAYAQQQGIVTTNVDSGTGQGGAPSSRSMPPRWRPSTRRFSRRAPNASRPSSASASRRPIAAPPTS